MKTFIYIMHSITALMGLLVLWQIIDIFQAIAVKFGG